ncbi:MAG: sugar transferase, partial [Acutalibacteraceae bacterium]|nr:sugar transferase [Acutalibacteraceae bacterium]
MSDKHFKTLPQEFQNEECEKYYSIIKSRYFAYILKRIFDYLVGLILLILLIIPIAVIAIIVKCGSKGPVMF